MIKINNKKSQNETIGFVLIILVIVIAAVVFLGFSLRKSNPNIATDAEITNFLSASGKYTTECYLNSIPKYRTIEDLERDCNSKNFEPVKCPDEMNACGALNKTYYEMFKDFRPGGRVLSYYKISFYYKPLGNETDTQKVPFMNPIMFGNTSGCLSKRGAMHEISADPGKLVTEIEVCESAV